MLWFSTSIFKYISHLEKCKSGAQGTARRAARVRGSGEGVGLTLRRGGVGSHVKWGLAGIGWGFAFYWGTRWRNSAGSGEWRDWCFNGMALAAALDITCLGTQKGERSPTHGGMAAAQVGGRAQSLGAAGAAWLMLGTCIALALLPHTVQSRGWEIFRYPCGKLVSLGTNSFPLLFPVEVKRPLLFLLAWFRPCKEWAFEKVV